MRKELKNLKVFLVLLLILSMFVFAGCADTNNNGIPDEPQDVVPDVIDNGTNNNNGITNNGADGPGDDGVLDNGGPGTTGNGGAAMDGNVTNGGVNQ